MEDRFLLVGTKAPQTLGDQRVYGRMGMHGTHIHIPPQFNEIFCVLAKTFVERNT